MKYLKTGYISVKKRESLYNFRKKSREAILPNLKISLFWDSFKQQEILTKNWWSWILYSLDLIKKNCEIVKLSTCVKKEIKSTHLTVNLNFAKFNVGILWIKIRIFNILSTFVEVDDVLSMDWTIDSLNFWRRTVQSLHRMKTKVAVFFRCWVWNIKVKTRHAWSISSRALKN